MALDPTIALQVRPVADPMEGMGRAMSLAALAQQGRLQQVQLEQAQREQEATRSIADMYRGAIGADGKVDRVKLTQSLASGGFGDKIAPLQKTWLETDKAQAELDKAHGEIDANKYKLAVERNKAVGSGIASLLANPNATAADVAAQLQGIHRAGLIDADTLAASIQSIPQDPQALRPWLIQHGMAVMETDKQLALLTPKLTSVNDGQTTRFVDTNPWTNPGGPAPIQMQLTPGDVQSGQIQRATLGETSRHNRATEAQAAATAAQSGAVVEKDAAGNFVVVNKGTGVARPVMGADGKPVGTGAAVKDANEALQLINQAIPLLGKSTGSYGGWAVDQLAQAFGKATDGSIAAGQLKAIEGALVAKMPKMSGPQSDKDVLLYRQMAAEVGNDTVPMERKAAALETLREIQERYAGVAPGSSRPKPKTQDASQRQGGASGDWSGAAPTQQQPAVEASATMGGKRYVKRGGNWYEVTP